MPTWHLDNADELAARYPYTFYKPSPALIARLAPGDLVKLIFRFESDDPEAPGAERMWVIVDDVLPQGRYRGRLDNDPRHITDLRHGDTVAFEACHIANTQLEEAGSDEGLVARYALRCFVTRRVLEDGRPVGYLYREEPDGEEDSGWRLTANDEDQAYMDNADNLAYVALGVVLNLDDSFIDLLDQPAGAAYFRDPDTGAFLPCDDEEDGEPGDGDGAELPQFTYHPDPVGTGNVEASDAVCRCCGQRRGFIYTGPVYAEEELDESLCPWCIADGSAHENFGATFTDEDGIGGYGEWDAVPDTVVQTVSQRTPGFAGWQQERWWTHCGDAGAFIGPAGKAELLAHGEQAVAAIQASAGLSDGPEWRRLLDALDAEGSPCAYVFRYLHCGALGGYQDSH